MTGIIDSSSVVDCDSSAGITKAQQILESLTILVIVYVIHYRVYRWIERYSGALGKPAIHTWKLDIIVEKKGKIYTET